MQLKVQNWTSTTFPAKSAIVSGSELSHPVAPSNEGSSPSARSGPRVEVWSTSRRLISRDHPDR